MKGPLKSVVPDNAMALEALKIGVRRALRIHKALGNPIAAERDGKVVWIPAEQIQVDDAPAASKREPAV